MQDYVCTAGWTEINIIVVIYSVTQLFVTNAIKTTTKKRKKNPILGLKNIEIKEKLSDDKSIEIPN